MQFNPLVEVAVALRMALGLWAQDPFSAVTVLLISVTMALVTNLVNRRLIDFERLRRSREEINKWQAMKRRVGDTTDERVKRKLLLKIKRRERYIMKLQGEVSKQSMKPMMVTIIPFMLLFAIMNGVFIDDTLTFVNFPIYAPVIYTPLHFAQILGSFGMGFGYHGEPGIQGYYPGVPLGSQGLFYAWWYILVSFTANMIFQRIFKTSTTG